MPTSTDALHATTQSAPRIPHMAVPRRTIHLVGFVADDITNVLTAISRCAGNCPRQPIKVHVMPLSEAMEVLGNLHHDLILLNYPPGASKMMVRLSNYVLGSIARQHGRRVIPVIAPEHSTALTRKEISAHCEFFITMGNDTKDLEAVLDSTIFTLDNTSAPDALHPRQAQASRRESTIAVGSQHHLAIA